MHIRTDGPNFKCQYGWSSTVLTKKQRTWTPEPPCYPNGLTWPTSSPVLASSNPHIKNQPTQVGCLQCPTEENGGGETWNHGKLPLSRPKANACLPPTRLLCFSRSHCSLWARQAHNEGILIMLLLKGALLLTDICSQNNPDTLIWYKAISLFLGWGK